MATQITRINPLDLQENIAIGVSLPFNGAMGPFNSTYSTQEQIKHNVVNLLLTSKGERIFNPELGSDLKRVVFEPVTDDNDFISAIQNIIIESINAFIPEIEVISINITTFPDENSISISVTYKIKISGNADQITVEFV